MFPYFLKRLILFIPSLWIISIAIFLLMKKAPGDALVMQEEQAESIALKDYLKEESRQKRLRSKYHLDEPLFYFSIGPKYLSDTINRIPFNKLRNNLKSLAFANGNWEAIHQYFYYAKLKDPEALALLFQSNSLEEHLKALNIKKTEKSNNILQVISNKNLVNRYLPSLSANLTNNQYHHWIMDFLSGEWGVSIQDGRAVKEKIFRALPWTIGLSLASILLSFLIAIPLALYVVSRQRKVIDKWLSRFFFSFYAIPTFWFGSLLLIYFASPIHFNWFPSYGTGTLDQYPDFFTQMLSVSYHMTLPLLCYTYGSVAYIYRQLTNSLEKQLGEDYILTAQAKGLSFKKTITQHAFKNSLFPLITIAAGLLPALVSGSIVIERLFSIPGMGNLSIDAVLSRDYNLIFTVSMLSCLLTLIGIWIADLAYQINDPRIRLK